MSGSWQQVANGNQPNNQWTCVASSYTGQYCIAGNNGANGSVDEGRVWISSDYGATWSTPTNSPLTAAWGGVAINQDGTMMACCFGQGTNGPNSYIFLSTDSGNTWTNLTTQAGSNPPDVTTIVWQSIAISIDLSTIGVTGSAGVVWIYDINTVMWTEVGGVSSSITSNIYGFVTIGYNNWPSTFYKNNGYTQVQITDANSNLNTFGDDNPGWTSISTSLDGTKLVMCAAAGSAGNQGYIYTGTLDSGSNYWTFIQWTGLLASWNKVQFGPDAFSIVACSRDITGVSQGTIWLGVSDGTSYTWSQQKDGSGNNLVGDWSSISRNLDKQTYTRFVAVTQSSTQSEDNGIWIFTSDKTVAQAEADLACVCRGMKILTPDGPVAIEELKVGDTVMTPPYRKRDRVVIQQVYTGTYLGDSTNIPCRIPKDFFEPNIPDEDILISPHHLVFYNGEWYLPKDLKGIKKEVSMIGQKFDYFHLSLPDYYKDKLWCHNLPIDSWDYANATNTSTPTPYL